MSHSPYLVKGRLVRRDNQQGIHGLLVEAWDEDISCDDCLGWDLTNRDGSFAISFHEEDFDEPYEGAPEIYLKIRDRDGRLIHDTRSQKRICQPGHTVEINHALVPDTLWWHRQTPVSWECPDDPLLPEIVIEDIQEALTLVTSSRQHGYNQRLEALICTIPPINLLNNIMSDACATLQGDLAAAGRYRDLLDALCAVRPKGKSCGHATIDDIFANPTPAPSGHCPPTEPEDPCAEPDPHEPDCPCKPSLIARDKTKTLLMAALHIACNHEKSAKTYVKTILDQVARYEFLASLHRAAVKALYGDAAALVQFRDLLELFLYPGTDQGCGCKCGGLSCCACLDQEMIACLRQMVGLWQKIHCYTVTTVQPERACPGEEIVIKGHGFGDKAGQIAFRRKGSMALGTPINVADWCDDQITVVVPEEAGCGLQLYLPVNTIEVCGRFLEYRPTGCMEADFAGTSAEILQFTVKGRQDGECLEPGAVLPIRWKTCAADRVRVEIVNADSGAVIAAQDPAEPRGRWDFTQTYFTETTHVTVRVAAVGKCKPPQVSAEMSFRFQRQPNLTVQGLEITQAIQHYRAAAHLTDAGDRGADNSLRLVTNKTAWVRTYLRSGQSPAFDNGQLADVNGTLTVERRVGGVWSTIATLPSQNGPVTAEDSFINFDAERGNIDNTLNFIVPAAMMTGLLRFTVNVESPYADCPGNTAVGSATVDVNLTQTLNAAFITIGYNGPDASGMNTLNLAAPTLADCQAETSWAMTTYPVSGAPNVRIAGTFTTNTPLNDPRSCPGCCSPNWGTLLPQVAALVAADQAANPGPWVYYGLINNGIPVNVPGCNGVATGGLAGRPQTYAHEIGHQFGLPHARCGNAGSGNASYPIYEPYDLPVDVPATPVSSTNWTMASIGEYGLDINNGNIANPNTAEDFMSYCSPRWISVFTHNYLVNRMELTPTTIPTGSGAATNRVIQDNEPNFTKRTDVIKPLVYLIGTLSADGEVAMSSVARLETRYLVGDGRSTRYIAQLLGEEGQIISQDVMYAYTADGCGSDDSSGCGGGCQGCGCADSGRQDKGPVMLKGMLDDLAPGQTLRIVKDGETVWERTAPKERPQVSNIRAQMLKDGRFSLSWRGQSTSEGQDEYWIRWSRDGQNWHALMVGVTDNTIHLDPEQLPSGEIQFQVMVHDGFYTTTVESNTVEIAARPPAVTILYPKQDDLAYDERQLHLWGTADSRAGHELAEEQFVWHINGEEVGRGRDIWVENPGTGEHKIQLSVTDGELEGVAETAVTIQPTTPTPPVDVK
ncbi:MAG: hypothetical protein CL608_04215 [Anaerolineaceae bacterium]|nr:hypothetical protein [Anaerolineaceae bacterium]